MNKFKPDNKIQRLYEVCRANLRPGQGTPSAEAVQNLREAIGAITAADLNLDVPPSEDTSRGFGSLFGFGGRQSSFSTRLSANVTSMQIHENEAFTLAVFCLPSSSSIPLHDHPGMTVISKLLYGSMHVRGYDWVYDGDMGQREGGSPARLCVDQVFTGPCDPLMLFPRSGGNIHAFTALTPCAVLDILTPPYNAAEGRNCTYYAESGPLDGAVVADAGLKGLSEAELSNGAMLEESQPPADFCIGRGIYRGPDIVP